MEKIVEEAFRHIPKLEISIDLPIGIQIQKLASGFCEAKDDAMRIQLDLNLQIVELRLKAQPSTPPEVKEKHHGAI